MNSIKKTKAFNIIIFVMFLMFLCCSYLFNFQPGKATGMAFYDVLSEMLKILPCAFILIGLFDVWVKKEKVIRNLGEESGLKGYLWVLLLAGFSIGGMYVAFPLAKTLHKKGASLKVIFTYLGFVGVCRIPMTLFEISFIGLNFTLIRLITALPLFLITGIFMGEYLRRKGYQLKYR